MDHKLIDYLPPFIREYREIKAIMSAEQEECEQWWSSADKALADQFVVEATETGLSRYEKIYGITPKYTHTVEERRFVLLARMSEQLPYTMETLHLALSSLCGIDGYVLQLDADAYVLIVRLDLSNESNYVAVCELLDKMVPANIDKRVSLYNTYLNLSEYTHDILAAYTYEALRKETI